MWAQIFSIASGMSKEKASYGVQTEQEDLGLCKAGDIQPGNIVESIGYFRHTSLSTRQEHILTRNVLMYI